MKNSVSISLFAAGTFAAVAALAVGAGSATADTPASSDQPSVIRDGRIGYVVTHRYWAVHQTPEGKVECTRGYNDGPREQFKQLFPEDGVKRTLIDTQLMREGRQWFPDTSEEVFTFKEAGGKVSFGMDLDGKVKDNDFVSPDGAKGIDNQLYRAIGCISNYRAPEGTVYHFENEFMRRYNSNRFMIELSGVDSLVNDGDVTVTTYRGLDALITDATGAAFIPGGTQRVDARFGKEFISSFKGKIVDGVLTTEGSPLVMPGSATFNTSTLHHFKQARFQLKLTPERAEGVIAGYVDVEAFNNHLNTTWSTHHQSYGQLSAPSLYRALRRLADGYPDDKGQMTAISAALSVKLAQVYIEHPPQQVAGSASGAASPTPQASRE
jgi:hypothetical protein